MDEKKLYLEIIVIIILLILDLHNSDTPNFSKEIWNKQSAIIGISNLQGTVTPLEDLYLLFTFLLFCCKNLQLKYR